MEDAKRLGGFATEEFGDGPSGESPAVAATEVDMRLPEQLIPPGPRPPAPLAARSCDVDMMALAAKAV